jgi:hypothetical protein
VGSSARPEALQVLDAQIAALDARAAELAARLEGETIVSPISGLLEMGGRSVVLRIYDLDPVYLRLALPERERHRVQVGSQVLFTTQATSLADFTGRVVDISEDAATAPDGTQVFWVSAEVANPELLLRSGMSGVARLDMDGGAGQVLGFWRELLGTGP